MIMTLERIVEIRRPQAGPAVRTVAHGPFGSRI
jgi:hypothetical protein